jgi:flagellar motor switch protein FliN
MQPILDWLVAQWTSRFREITLAMGDLQLQMHVARFEEAASQTASGFLWWEQPFSCSPDSFIWLGCPEETWVEIGKIILAAAGVDPAPASEVQSTYLEIVSQSMSRLAQDIGQRISSGVTSGKGNQAPPRETARHNFKIEAELRNKSVIFYLSIADDLPRNVSAAGWTSALDTSKEQQSPGDNPAELSPATGSRTFELLLDVELPVSVSFGRSVLKLQDAMKLITGSLIELNRAITDPVELLVNNCVIARGEVVVIHGNYGMRITEIISYQERLQQSRRYMLK